MKPQPSGDFESPNFRKKQWKLTSGEGIRRGSRLRKERRVNSDDDPLDLQFHCSIDIYLLNQRVNVSIILQRVHGWPYSGNTYPEYHKENPKLFHFTIIIINKPVIRVPSLPLRDSSSFSTSHLDCFAAFSWNLKLPWLARFVPHGQYTSLTIWAFTIV